ncbi:BspA family leucine-rich repeat surface protein [Enterococcus asini]|uniref:BspA family leucine-rich repeat surface protein n=2 Tax=Enterococcus asini TaxID=57732 RepID=UPI002891C8F5|nr:BspA family leucine-rich repeat surface protein [Enterococcus asini]MDT2784294.1 BspA family leucine-rich repeat surface protein [Enterococcus asini]
MRKFGRKHLYSTVTVFATMLMMPHSSLVVFAEPTPTTAPSAQELAELQESLLPTLPVLNSSSLLGSADSGTANTSAEAVSETATTRTTESSVEVTPEVKAEASTTDSSEDSTPVSSSQGVEVKETEPSAEAEEKTQGEVQSAAVKSAELITGRYADGGLWTFDLSDGTLTFAGGTLSESDNAGWSAYKGSIKKVVFASLVKGGQSLSGLFESHSSLESIENMENLDTSNVENMSAMFSDCLGLTTLNVRNFDTSKVEDMFRMFYGCRGLRALDASNFNTSKVNNMDSMFSNCKNLESLNLSSFTTSEAGANLSSMFYGVPLKKLTLGKGWVLKTNTLLLNRSWRVIEGENITTLADTASLVASHNQAGQTRTYYDAVTYAPESTQRVTFKNPSGSEVIPQLVSKGELLEEPAPPTKKESIFKGWSKTEVGGEFFNFDTPINEDLVLYAQWEVEPHLKANGFYGDNDEGYWYLDKVGTLRLEGGTLTTTSSAEVPWKAYRDEVKKVVFATEVKAGKQISYLFSNHQNLEAFTKWSNFDTSETEDMEGLFYRSKKLVHLDLRSFNTEKVTSMVYMFSGCTGLESIDLSSFVTTEVTDMRYMFSECASLKQLDVSTFTIPSSSSQMFASTDFSSLVISGETQLSSEMSIPVSNWLFANESKIEKYNTADLIKQHNQRKQTTTYYNEKYNRGVAFDSQGGTEIPPQILATGAKVTEPAEPPTRAGYTFLGWSKSKTETTFFDFNTEAIETDLTLYARWESVSGGYEDGTWELDDNGVLTLSGGKLTTTSAADVPWKDYVEDVRQVVFASEVEAGASLVELFAGHKKLETIQDFQKLNLEQTSDVSRLFQGCLSLDLLDLSEMDITSEVLMTDLFKEAKIRQLILDGSFVLTEDVNLEGTNWYWTDADGRIQLAIDTAKLLAKQQTLDVPHHYYNSNNFWMMTYGNDSGGVGIYDRDNRALTLFGGVIDSTHVPRVYPMESVRKIIFGSKVTAGENLTELFANYPGITAIENLANFDTSQATNMSKLFAGYQGAGTLDLSGFDTSKVTNMSEIFSGCTNLETLDLRGFVTTEVTDMSEMFYECGKLTALDVSELDTTAVITMSSMFSGCEKLTALDVTGFDTANVKGMSYMFYNCKNLEVLDVSKFDTTKATTMSGMFRMCSKLETLALRNFHTENVTSMSGMFQYATALKELDLSSFDSSNVTTMNSMFFHCESLTTLDISSFVTPAAALDTSGMFASVPLQKLTLGKEWTMPSNTVLRTSKWFVAKNATVTELATTPAMITSHNEDKQTRSYYAEDGFDSVETAEIVTFDSLGGSEVSDQIIEVGELVQKPDDPKKSGHRFFGWSTSETEVALFDFEKTAIQGDMTLYALWSKTGEYEDGGNWWLDPDGTLSLDGGTLNTAGASQVPWADYKASVKKVIFVSEVTGGKKLEYLFSNYTSLRTIEGLEQLNTSSVENMMAMFSYCSSLETLDVSSFDTSSVADMSYMFTLCSGLEILDVSGFDTSSVTNFRSMFVSCSGLKTLDVSGFDTSSATNMNAMFSGCSSLDILDVGNFDTSKVEDMSSTFSQCSGLQTLDVSGFDTSKVEDMRSMFSHCSGLKTLDVSGFDTSSVMDMSYMFALCSDLQTLDVSGFDTSSATNLRSMFVSCSGLKTLDLSNFVANKDGVAVNSMSMLFNISLTKLTIGGAWTISTDTGLREAKWYVAEGDEICTLADTTELISNHNEKKLTRTYYESDAYPFDPTSDYVVNFDSTGGNEISAQIIKENERVQKPANPKKSGHRFIGWSTSETEVELFDFEKTAVQGDMTLYAVWSKAGEYADEGTWTLDVNGVLTLFGGTLTTESMSDVPWAAYRNDVKKVVFASAVKAGEKIRQLFASHGKLTTFENLANFDTSSVKDMSSLFRECVNLSVLDVSNFDTSQVQNMQSMFYGCSGLDTLDVSNFDTSQVQYMEYMFSGCSGLDTLDVSNFDTSQVKYMQYMFSRCSGLDTLDVSNFDTSQVKYMQYMFSRCSGLDTLDVSNFDTSQVQYMEYMFYDCSGLDTLDLSGFDTSQVQSMQSTFFGCSGLDSLDLSSFDTSKVRYMLYMFYGCSDLDSLDLSNFDTSQVQDMECMFYGCSKLATLDLSNFDTSRISNMGYMFYKTPLTKITLGGNFTIVSATELWGTQWVFADGGEIAAPLTTPDMMTKHNRDQQTRTYFETEAYDFETGTHHVITFDSTGGSEVPAQIVTSGEKAAVPVTRRPGYALVGWFMGDAETAYDFDNPVTASLTLTARWEASSSYTLTIPSEISLNDSKELAVSATTASVTDTLRVSLKDGETENDAEKGQLILTHEDDETKTHRVGLNWQDKEDNLVLYVPANVKGQGKDKNRITFTLPEIKEPGDYHGVLTFEASFTNEEVEQ